MIGSHLYNSPAPAFSEAARGDRWVASNRCLIRSTNPMESNSCMVRYGSRTRREGAGSKFPVDMCGKLTVLLTA
jgi:hypothetical protein